MKQTATRSRPKDAAPKAAPAARKAPLPAAPTPAAKETSKRKASGPVAPGTPLTRKSVAPVAKDTRPARNASKPAAKESSAQPKASRPSAKERPTTRKVTKADAKETPPTRKASKPGARSAKEEQRAPAVPARFRPVWDVDDLRRRGVRVDSEQGEYVPDERETVLSYMETDTHFEITTGDFKLQRQLEEAGAVPHHVVTFAASPITLREYIVPRRALSITVKPMKKTRQKKSGERAAGASQRSAA